MTTTDAAVDQALLAATRAPSVHNTAVACPHVDLHLDRERVLPVADPGAREARLSCGAALFNLRAALRAAGVTTLVDLVPDPARPDLLAVVRLGGCRPPTPEETDLAAAIDRRATNRRPFLDRPVPPRHRIALVRAAEAERGHLYLLDTPRAFDTFATLLRRADHLQEEDPACRRELRGWTDEAGGRDEGVPRSAGGPRPIGGSLLTPRRFHTRAALRTLPAVRGFPQTVLRVGYGYPAARTPRRPVAAVATIPDRDEVPS